MTARRVLTALLAVLVADLALILITGDRSLFAARGLTPVGPLGFAARAALVGVLGLVRFRALPSRWHRVSVGSLVLALLLLPTLVHFQVSGGRINGDGLSYYVFVHSLWKDGDFDLTNEYAHFGMLSRGDLQVLTKTGLRRTIYSVGPAVVWAPFFGLGELVGRAERLLGGAPDLSGYGPYHRNAVALGSLLYGFFALVLIHRLLLRHFSEGTALAAVLLVYGATFHYWYMVLQPTYSHAASAFFAALALWLWDRGRGTSRPLAFLGLGLVLGVAMSVRWQNGILLLLPGLDLVARFWRAPRRPLLVLPHATALGAGALVGVFPQMLAWKAIYDYWILPYPPQGPGFVRLHHPFVLETLFASRHGLLSWTPVFWLGFLGFVPLARRRPALALILLLPLVLMCWVNMGVADYWGGASFSNRRFDSLLPVFAFGFAASIDTLRRVLGDRPRLAVAALAACVVPWNLALAEQVRRQWVAPDDTVAFATLARNAAQLVSDRVGFPTTWPASWIFAARHGRPPSQYDLVVGRYLFYMQNNLGGRLEVGLPGAEAMLAGGWSGVEARDGALTRRIEGRARLFANLDVPEDLEVRVRLNAAAARPLRLRVNGALAGEVVLSAGWTEAAFAVPAARWHREVNDVELTSEADANVLVATVEFVRTNPNPRRWV
jgi:hypothetical protein